MGEVGVDGNDVVLLCMKIDVLISDVGCYLLHLNIQLLNFFVSTEDLEMSAKHETACWNGPLAVLDILSGIMEEVKV